MKEGKEGEEGEELNGVWQLPVLEKRTINEQYIKHNAKYHYYERTGIEQQSINSLAKSICGKHTQQVDEYESIESGQILQFPVIACKMCFERWKKIFYYELISKELRLIQHELTTD